MNLKNSPLMLVAAAALIVSGTALDAVAQNFGGPTPRHTRPGNREYRWGTRTYTRELAEDLVREANAICVEMHSNYQNNPGFRETYREAYSMIIEAKHIQQLIREGYLRNPRGNDDHIERDLRSLDREFHHIESDIRRWRIDYRGPGRSNPQTLTRLMSDFDRTLNLLMTDYGVRDTTYDRRDRRDDRRDDRFPGPPRR